MDQFWPNPRNGGAPRNAVPVGAFRQGNGPSLERGVLNGDDLHFARRRRRTRSSHSESQGSGQEEEWMGGSMEASHGSYGQSPVLHHGMQGEPIWYNRSAYEQAESNYQRRLAGTATAGNEPLSSSPRGAGTRGSSSSRTLTFRSKRPYGQQQQENWDQEYPSNTNKSPGTRRRQSSRGRNRSSSETEQGGKGSRGPPRRRRGYSETESRPRWDNTKMSGVECFATENIWFDKHRYDEAEKRFYEGANGPSTQSHHQDRETTAILQDIAKSCENIWQCLDGVRSAQQPAKGRQQKRQHRNSSSHGEQELISRMKSMELENQSLHKVVEDMRAALRRLESRVTVLEKTPKTSAPAAVPCARSVPVKQVKVESADDDDDDDIDLFGSDDEEDAEAERLKQERLDAYAAKKAKKPALIAKSSILLDVKPWDDETDMVKLEECVRSVVADGLLWGASKLVPVGYGIKKLQINCVVEDDKVGTDMLEEEITKFEDYVQSVDVAAFNKI